jgi:hypothetical protein
MKMRKEAKGNITSGTAMVSGIAIVIVIDAGAVEDLQVPKSR